VHLSIYLKQEVWLELGPKGNSSAAGESRSEVQRSEEGEVRDIAAPVRSANFIFLPLPSY
jgi:hypothetical protein